MIDTNMFLTSVKAQSYVQGQEVFHEADPSNELIYFILSGTLEVYHKLDGSEKKKINTLNAKQFFGEIALLMDKPRSATVEVVSESARVACFSKKSFIHESVNNVKFAYGLFKQAIARIVKIQNNIQDLKIPPHLEVEDTIEILYTNLRRLNLGIAEYVNQMHQTNGFKNQNVYTENELSNRNIYIILEGHVTISMEKNGIPFEYGHLSQGDMFGLEALVQSDEEQRHHSATVTSEETRLLFIDRFLLLKTIPLNPIQFYNMFRLVLWYQIDMERIYKYMVENRKAEPLAV